MYQEPKFTPYILSGSSIATAGAKRDTSIKIFGKIVRGMLAKCESPGSAREMREWRTRRRRTEKQHQNRSPFTLIYSPVLVSTAS